MNNQNTNENAAREAGQLTTDEILTRYANGESLGELCPEWPWEKLMPLVNEYARRGAAEASVKHLDRYVLGEKEWQTSRWGKNENGKLERTKGKLTKAERALLGPEDTDEHAED